MEFQALEDAVRFRRREGVVQSTGGMGREIVLHDPDRRRIRVMNVGQIAHAGSKILRSPLRGDLHMSPRLVRIEEHEQISGAITLVFVVIPLRLAGLGWRTSPINWVGVSSKHTTGRFGSAGSAYRSSTSSIRAT